MQGIKRLAQHLNISIGTVSRALNGRPDVNDDTRRRVLAAARELGYVANQSGRSLRQGTTNAIGFTMELDPEGSFNGDNFFLGVFDGVKRGLAAQGLDLVVLPCSADEDPVEYVRRIIGRRLVDGLILSATQRRDRRIELLSKAGVPFVALGRSETKGEHPWIDLDFEGYIKTSVDRLVGFGHTRIALGAHTSEINLRYVQVKTFNASMKRHGLSTDGLVVPTSSSEQGGYELADRLLAMEPRPTAVILGYELMALGLYHRLDELRLLPGRDIAVIGLRESPQSRSLLPRLTCFRTALPQLGVALAKSLLDVMPNRTPPAKPVRTLWPIELIPGDSDGPLSKMRAR